MNNWKLEYWHENSDNSSVETWFDELTKEQFKSITKELKLLVLCGNNLRLPHSKSLGKKLFELRERKYGYRIYYTFYKQHIILLNAGDKNSQERDIKTARTRLSSLINQER